MFDGRLGRLMGWIGVKTWTLFFALWSADGRLWRVKGGGLEFKYGHCSLHCEMLMEGLEGPFSIEWHEPVFPTCYCLWISTNGIIFIFLFSKKRQQVDIVGPMEFLGNRSKYNIVYHQIEQRRQNFDPMLNQSKYLGGKQNWYLSMDFIYALWFGLCM
jgi:hypothetical protein